MSLGTQVREALRFTIALAAYTSGVALIRARALRKDQPLVRAVLIHHIKDADRFEAMIRTFAQKYHPISYDDLRLKRFHSSKINILVTMDDGYESWYTKGLAILQRYQVPALLFIPSGFVEVAGDREAVERYCEHNLKLPKASVPLAAAMVIACAEDDLVTIGGHTRNHPFLTQLPNSDIQDEIARDKEWLEGTIGSPVPVFAYPFGDYDESVKAAVMRAGYTHAMTTKSDFYRLDSDSFEVPRSNHGTVSPLELSMWVWGAYDLAEMILRFFSSFRKNDKKHP